jgi:hypothetical protein
VQFDQATPFLIGGLAAVNPQFERVERPLKAPTALASQVRAALRCAIDYVADDPCKGRVAISIALASPVLAERRSHATELIATIIADMGSRYVSPNSDRAQLLTTTRFFVGGFSEILTVWMNDPSSATRDELVDSCTQLFLAVTAPVLSATPS